METWLAVPVVLFAAGVLFWAKQSVHEEDVWSIGIFSGADPLSVGPHPGVVAQPVLSARDVTDVPAEFVADPFLVRTEGRWHMFFEVLNSATQRGEIACATSDNCLDWTYDRIVLAEPFHLSYPCVFRSGNEYYMIPETSEASSIRLYRASSYPHKWTFVSELLRGHYLDASVLQRAGQWWLFSFQDNRRLSLHFANELTGPWIEHPSSPIAEGIEIARPGGRIIVEGERVLRFSQDGTKTYGRRLHAFEVTTLTTQAYAERRASSGPVIGETGAGWNAHGMHHIDALRLPDDSWVAAVDGKFIRKRFIWRKGVRALLNCLSAPLRPRSASSTQW